MVALQLSPIVLVSIILDYHDRMSEFAGRDAENRFEELVVGTLREAHPDLFDGGAA
jgi:hypothetical protein